ncbi:P-loop containing nucleoside triphosphate hydrolase protein [Aspergillus spectabilis]
MKPLDLTCWYRHQLIPPLPFRDSLPVLSFHLHIDEKERSDFQELKELSSSPDDPGSLKDDQKRLLPPEVYGFVLRTRRWATFDIKLLEEPDYSNGWKNLVIKPDTKELVHALVENHERPRGELGKVEGALPSVDLVQGKGKGLIILLHGEPGVGKTSTAECVAAHTKRPLFPITCGDIGEKADEAEDNLERNFQLAHKWGCVLLLDEADVFLSKRTSDDIQQNAIVSVFLRTLEYYSGILFLTTNRVGKIDRAFKSRIHLSIFYPKLDLASTRQIWENNLETTKENLRKQNLRLMYEKDEILSFAEEHFKRLCKSKKRLRTWNGRQIRNAFQTAVAIAKYETSRVANATPNLVILSDKQFKTVAEMAENFDTYLNTLHNGKNDADLAKGAQLRVDDYVTESTQRGDEDRKKEKEREKVSRNRSPSTDRRRHKRRRNEKQSESEESSSAYSSDSSEEDRRPSRKRREKRGHGRAR